MLIQANSQFLIMKDIMAQSFEIHEIQRQAVVVYGNVYTYTLVIHTVETKRKISI